MRIDSHSLCAQDSNINLNSFSKLTPALENNRGLTHFSCVPTYGSQPKFLFAALDAIEENHIIRSLRLGPANATLRA